MGFRKWWELLKEPELMCNSSSGFRPVRLARDVTVFSMPMHTMEYSELARIRKSVGKPDLKMELVARETKPRQLFNRNFLFAVDTKE
jgi:hypothetical protein